MIRFLESLHSFVKNTPFKTAIVDEGGNRRASSSGNLKKALAGLLVLAGFGGLMYVKNRMIPKYADDYSFSFIWDGKHHGNLAYGKQVYKRVRSLRGLVRSQISHFFSWSGRTVAETLNQLVLMKDDKKLYDMINTGAILTQLLICAKAAAGKKRGIPLSAPVAALLSGGYWFAAPYLIHTAFWITGAANYSWPGILQSAFLLPYAQRFFDAGHRQSPVYMGLMGLLAGWSNEAGGGIAAVLSGLSYLRSKRRMENTGWMLAGLIGVCTGYALLMFAPGNLNRVRIEKEYSDIMPEEFNGLGNVPAQYLYTKRMFMSHFRNGFLPVVLRQLPLQVPVALYLMQGAGKEKADLKYLTILELASLSVPSVLMLSPEFPVRAAYVSVLFSMTAAAFALERISEPALKQWEGAGKLCTFAGISFFIINYFSSLVADADLHSQIDGQIEALLKHRDEEDIILPNVSVSAFWSFFAGDRSLKDDLLQATWLDKNPEDPYNKAVAAYYGTESFSVEDVSAHPYRQKGKKALIYSIINPLKSFLKRLRKIFSGDNGEDHEALQ